MNHNDSATKVLIAVTIDKQQARNEFNKTVKELQSLAQQRASELELDLKIDMSSAASALREQQKLIENMQKQSKQYWSGRFKESLSDMTSTNTELQKMAQYYKELEKTSAQVAKGNKEMAQSYWDNRFKESVKDMTAVNDELVKMRKYYTDLSKVEGATYKQADALHNLQLRARGASDSFEAYTQKLKPTALKEYASRIDNILKSFKEVSSAANFDEANKSFKRASAEVAAFKGEMKKLGHESRTALHDTLNNLKKFASWYILGNIIVGVLSKISQVYDNVKALDKAMTNLMKVSTGTAREYANHLDTLIYKAKELGATVAELVESSADWARLGYSLQESSELAQSTAIYSNVGDMSMEQATTSLISTLKGFNLEASQSIDIVDKFNEVSFLPLCA